MDYKKLTEKEIDKNLEKIDEGWVVTEDKKLITQIEGENFMEMVELVNDIAKLAEKMDHHPNLSIFDYKKLEIELYTHRINDLSQIDFDMAVEIDKLLN